jgi:hypothetical protein
MNLHAERRLGSRMVLHDHFGRGDRPQGTESIVPERVPSARPRFVHLDHGCSNGLAVQGLDGGLGALRRGHGYKGDPARPAGGPIGGDIDFRNIAMDGKQLPQFVFRSGSAQLTDVDFCVHNGSSVKAIKGPGCSRTSHGYDFPRYLDGFRIRSSRSTSSVCASCCCRHCFGAKVAACPTAQTRLTKRTVRSWRCFNGCMTDSALGLLQGEPACRPSRIRDSCPSVRRMPVRALWGVYPMTLSTAYASGRSELAGHPPIAPREAQACACLRWRQRRGVFVVVLRTGESLLTAHHADG